ncbi:Uncharacterised protein [uncultured archaeon]|nr:Uncharacterised protein [uncultured archaeon]
MDDNEKSAMAAKAARLEDKMLFVKAAELYAKLSMPEKAAAAYEKGSAFDKAAELFDRLGKKEDAARCRAKRDAASTGQTWQDMQSEFQKDSGNPY